jgi:vitamin B12 transporter
MKSHFTKAYVCAVLLTLVIFAGVRPVWAMESEMEVMRLFYKEKELVVSPTRAEKDISEVAENITVVTAREIRSMHAHTLADVLNHLPGVQLDAFGGIAQLTNVRIQGSDTRHVLVLLDGVKMNNLSDGFADVAAMPVQQIERIEIIKGPASSAWGSSLGGVINVITKETGQRLRPSATVWASYGEENTEDVRGDVAGDFGPLGYYVSGTGVRSDGFSPNREFEMGNFYGKFHVGLWNGALLTLSANYTDGKRGLGRVEDFGLFFDNEFRYFSSSLTLKSPLTNRVHLSASIRDYTQDASVSTSLLTTGERLQRDTFDDRSFGGSLTLTSELDSQTIVAGLDYDNRTLDASTLKDNKTLREAAVYINDTIRWKDFSVTPGLRYDHISISDDFVSPSLGVTYALRRDTIIRAFFARGFNAPPLSFRFGSGAFSRPNPGLDVEKVWSYQAGVESSALRFMWVKLNAFLHNVEDEIVSSQKPDGTFITVNRDEIRRRGFEIKVETVPIHSFTLGAGYLLLDAENRETGEPLESVPKYAMDLDLTYENLGLTGKLLGHYVRWNPSPSGKGDYDDYIWDLHLSYEAVRTSRRGLELFVVLHNIFDGEHFLDESTFATPGRWIEGGVRAACF